MSTTQTKSNFAYNFTFLIGKLKATLIEQFIGEDRSIAMTVEEPNEDTKIEKYYKDGEEKPVCAVIYCKEGIFYYE